ncbi:Alpha/Beta hydrolase protein [Collybia nuda]|uniref:Alpha/Beta hydrolase protein n=1 Tax=Collybia nuda TaxID=64659 RepID=A0A9P6CFJ7_9AGAR|nr:Alpha/Beta hydrolase protein [Collybia nuda]
MMVVFQRRIIYMGYAPLGSRKEEIRKHVPLGHLRGISCEEICIKGEGKVTLAGIVVRQEGHTNEPPGTVIVYLQGNAGNPLHRLPVFQQLLRAPAISSSPQNTRDVAVVAVAPRSYWKSTPSRPTERGLLSDYLHTLHYTLDRFPSSRIIFYGHSLGGAAAICLLSKLHEATDSNDILSQRYHNIKGIILENPFASIPGMVRALYPQPWLPYRHLAQLAFDKWDAAADMRMLSTPSCPNTTLKRLAGNMLILLSENDEIVPPAMGTELYNAAVVSSAAATPRLVVVKDALHENAWDKRQWLPEMKRYIDVIRNKRDSNVVH